MFTKIISKFKFQPEVDLIASRLNAQLPVFISYHPDPEAMHINAFSISCQGKPFYVFPPFAVIGKVLHKIVFDVATGIIVVPDWPTQPWYILLMRLLIRYSHFTTFYQNPPSTSCKEHTTPSSQQAESASFHDIRQKPGAANLSAESIRIIQQNRHPSKIKRYDNYIGK